MLPALSEKILKDNLRLVLESIDFQLSSGENGDDSVHRKLYELVTDLVSPKRALGSQIHGLQLAQVVVRRLSIVNDAATAFFKDLIKVLTERFLKV